MSQKILITKKLYFHLVIGALVELMVLSVLALLAPDFFRFEVVIFIVGFYVIFVFWTCFADIDKPFRVVLDQVKALLTGRNYKKIFTDRTDEIGVFAHFFNEVTSSLEKVTEDLDEIKKVSGELKTAGQLQKELIQVFSPKIPGFEISVKNRSAEELGGDNLDFIQVKNSTYFYVGDVTGHGVPAAIVMTMVNTLLHTFSELYNTAYEVVVNTNRRLKMRIRATMFMSMLMLKWDGDLKKMTYVGCGHEYLLIYRKKTATVESRISGGIALGMVPDNSKIVVEKELPVEEGDIIVLYTDGITEAKNMSGEMFGLERLKETIALYGPHCDAKTLLQNVARDFSRFVEEHVQEDDITLVAIRRLADDTTVISSVDETMV